ncbi:MAG: PEP-CTERM sorting domain-containing protein [Limnoraphis robusta]|uniref:PEP-CTERM protein-sorting domain-containing protein n=1 Tax=Limnoraphis robusta CS-951 TaxID=1637645 RepID=A0A0F5YB47_9CYAN|nr:PEP-CTERM sorting domain-containing protein [Limnoraphis robusta]KKD35968.1 hypothetical protein WN50_22390 [Limnoraphis robusta CS-951]
MKMIKLITVTALTLGAVFGSFVESAVARGGRWSGSSTAEPENYFEFSLFTQTPRGQDIRDSKRGNRNLGLFKGAIENFSFCSQSDDADTFPNLGNGCELSGFTGSYIDDSFPVLDLQARNREGVVEYSFLLPNTNKQVFPIDSLLFNFQLRLDRIPSELRLDPVNSLKDIFSLFNLRDDDGELLLKSLLNSTNSDADVEIQYVPEPSSMNALFAIGILGAGFGLKRRFKIKS